MTGAVWDRQLSRDAAITLIREELPVVSSRLLRPTFAMSSTALAARPEPVAPPSSPPMTAADSDLAPVAVVAPREPEVDFLRRAQARLVVSPGDALALADDHPPLYPRGVLSQEREVIAIDALVRLGRRADAAARAARFRAMFPRSAHLSRLATLTGRP